MIAAPNWGGLIGIRCKLLSQFVCADAYAKEMLTTSLSTVEICRALHHHSLSTLRLSPVSINRQERIHTQSNQHGNGGRQPRSTRTLPIGRECNYVIASCIDHLPYWPIGSMTACASRSRPHCRRGPSSRWYSSPFAKTFASHGSYM